MSPQILTCVFLILYVVIADYYLDTWAHIPIYQNNLKVGHVLSKETTWDRIAAVLCVCELTFKACKEP
jgi:hypothetical protein